MSLNRDELEREIVTYDKQKLITQCLKLFDSNVGLVDLIAENQLSIYEDGKEMIRLKAEVDKFRQRKWWQLINDRLSWKIEKRRKQRLSVNYPMI